MSPVAHKIALFSDIHGNIAALERFLRAMEAERPDKMFCLGDLVGYGQHPNEVIDLIRHLGVPTVMGNYDEGVGFDKGDCGCFYPDEEAERLGKISYEFTVKEVTPENKAFLRNLPRELSFTVGDGIKFHLVHGSPRKTNEYLLPERPARSFERLAASERSSGYHALAFGHTHLGWHRAYGGVLFVAVGSLGKPSASQPNGQFTLLEVPPGAKSITELVLRESFV